MLLDPPSLRAAAAPTCTHPEAASRLASARRKASPEALERRRFARAAASARARPPAPPRDWSAEEAARGARQLRVCAEMIRRFVPAGRRGEPLLVDYRYWQLRRCGWDVLRERWRWTEPPRRHSWDGTIAGNPWHDPACRGPAGAIIWAGHDGGTVALRDVARPDPPHADPADCPVWRWWRDLHHETRAMLVKESRRAGVRSAGDDRGDGGDGVPPQTMVLTLGDAAADVRSPERRI